MNKAHLTAIGLSREESHDAVRLLLEQGLTRHEIADLLGVAVSTVNSWHYDRDGQKLRERKNSYRGVCPDCGGPTNGSDGARLARRCRKCSSAKQKAGAYWTRERLLERVQSWERLYGAPPSARDWNTAPSMLGRLTPETRATILERWRSERWPHTSTAIKVFGSFNQLIAASGFTPRPPGSHGRRR